MPPPINPAILKSLSLFPMVIDRMPNDNNAVCSLLYQTVRTLRRININFISRPNNAPEDLYEAHKRNIVADIFKTVSASLSENLRQYIARDSFFIDFDKLWDYDPEKYRAVCADTAGVEVSYDVHNGTIYKAFIKMNSFDQEATPVYYCILANSQRAN